MSYVVFALKWRPKNFDEIVGQNHIVSILKNAIQKNRLAHAYLFAGPRGVGKTSAARILAKALNCKNGPTVSPCGSCPSCLEISRGQSLDVVEIDGASNRGIDEIRALRESVKFAPAQGTYKIYIIDEVHQITAEGFNALLKTLEEPPPFVKFIFATTHPHKVLPTILSRCQRMDFRRVSVNEIIGQLEKISQAEKIAIDKDVLFAVAKASDGSLRDAESILDQLFSYTQGRVQLTDVTAMLGLVEQDTLFDITEKIIAKDTAGALGFVHRIIDEGKDPAVFADNLVEHYRNLMVAKVSRADPELLDLPQELCARLLKQAEAMTLEDIFSGFTTLVKAQEMARMFDSVRIPLEIGLVRLTYVKARVPAAAAPRPVSEPIPPPSKPTAPAGEPPRKIIKEGGSVRIPHEPASEDGFRPPPTEKPRYDEPPSSGSGTGVQAAVSREVSLEAIKESWRLLIDNIGKTKISVSTYLSEGAPAYVEDSILTVVFPKNCLLHKEALETRENKLLIERNISNLYHAELRINFVLSDVRNDERKEKETSYLKSALDMFGGRVIKEE